MEDLSNYCLDYYRREGYKFLPGDEVRIEINGVLRQARVSAPYLHQGKRAYSGTYLDSVESFIDILEESIYHDSKVC